MPSKQKPPARPAKTAKAPAQPKPEVLVLQHISCENPGTISDALSRARIGAKLVATWKDAVPQSPPDGIAGVVIMGGPMGVYESDKFKYLKDEMKLIESAVAQDIPVLGVCLGAQLMAGALAGDVKPGPKKEIGWYPVQLDAGGTADPIFSKVPKKFMAFHWHGDRFELPKGAVRLAHSALTPNQAFRYGKSAYALQFHLEVNRKQVGMMAEVFASELKAEKIGADSISGIAGKYLPEMEKVGRTVFDDWAALVKDRYRAR